MSTPGRATLMPDEITLIEAELEKLRRRRERVAADLESIRDTVGDLVDSDAADQIAIAEELTEIDDRIAELNWHLHGGPPESEVPGALPDGTEVTVRFADEEEPVHLRVVAIVADVPIVDEHAFAPDSPLALALAGHRPGDVVTFQTPRGTQRAELLAIRYPH
ncbi:GreA/GreB family elongation factor [Mycolicibacterium sp. 050158]|uniref:GreA/GreB family elongation factor n=1 Tax=Mycolicibacterium sp. 050158 TaxID=3090602 RepID=UPI00299DEFDF|nr:GreA/GreB family elongation factor [Mycolicibacterium sp. 050158]MDX1891416.1 GreA/GreB family elongation factor [Mycolicibacterium sp. 050158]